MFVTDAIAALSEYLPEGTKSDRTRLIQESVATLCIGEHGPEYRSEKPSPADYESHLGCGCKRFFPMPTLPGELLFCTLHDDWYKSQPKTEKKADPKATYFVKCDSCTTEYGPLLRPAAYGKAKIHSVGKNANKNPKHTVRIGNGASGQLLWRDYEYRGRG